MFLFFPLSLPLLLLLSCPKRYKPSTHLEDEQQSRNPSGQRTPFIIELIVWIQFNSSMALIRPSDIYLGEDPASSLHSRPADNIVCGLFCHKFHLI
jgi:hypothetical protein